MATPVTWRFGPWASQASGYANMTPVAPEPTTAGSAYQSLSNAPEVGGYVRQALGTIPKLGATFAPEAAGYSAIPGASASLGSGGAGIGEEAMGLTGGATGAAAAGPSAAMGAGLLAIPGILNAIISPITSKMGMDRDYHASRGYASRLTDTLLPLGGYGMPGVMDYVSQNQNPEDIAQLRYTQSVMNRANQNPNQLDRTAAIYYGGLRQAPQLFDFDWTQPLPGAWEDILPTTVEQPEEPQYGEGSGGGGGDK